MRFRILKRFQIILVLIISACDSPLPPPNSIATVSPSPLVTVVPTTPRTASTATATMPSPTETPQIELEVNSTVTILDCYCDGRAKSVMLTIEPVGGIGPYSLSVEPYIDTRTPFNDIQNFEANPGSVLTIHVYSSDSRTGTVVVQVPSSCGIKSTCNNTQDNENNQSGTVVPPQPPSDPPPPVEVCIPPNPNSQKCKKYE